MRRAAAFALVSCLGVAGAPAEAQEPPIGDVQRRAVRGYMLRDCALEDVPLSDLLLAVGVYGGQTLSNVAIGSGDKAEGLKVVSVRVEPGEQPITIAVSLEAFHALHFSGATERIRKVVAIPARGLIDAGIAVVGVERNKVALLTSPSCGVASQMLDEAVSSFDAPRARNSLMLLFGRNADARKFIDSVEGFDVPSLLEAAAPSVTKDRLTIIQRGTDGTRRTIIETDDKGRSVVRRPFDSRSEAARELYDDSYGGGLRRLPLNEVVASQPVSEPETYPEAAGFLQLEQSGGLRRPRAPEVREWQDAASRPWQYHLGPKFRFDIMPDWVVTRDIMLPIGAGDRTFLVPAGVPKPRGSRRGACFLMPDGQVDETAMAFPFDCYGRAKEAMAMLQTAPASADPACRVMPVADTVSVQAVSIFQATRTTAVEVSAPKRPKPVEILVERPGDVLLVLNSRTRTAWRVLPARNARVVGVVMTGYWASTLEGVAPEVPVQRFFGEEGFTRASWPPPCRTFFGWHGTAYEGGPEAIALDRQVQALTGRRLDELHGGLYGNRFEIR